MHHDRGQLGRAILPERQRFHPPRFVDAVDSPLGPPARLDVYHCPDLHGRGIGLVIPGQIGVEQVLRIAGEIARGTRKRPHQDRLKQPRPPDHLRRSGNRPRRRERIPLVDVRVDNPARVVCHDVSLVPARAQIQMIGRIGAATPEQERW